MIHLPQPPSAVLAVIHHHDDPSFILTVWNKKYSFLGLPGGKIEQGETPLAAILREVREEVGVTITSFSRPEDREVRIGPNVIARAWGLSERYIGVFDATSWAGVPRMCEDGAPIAWVTIDFLIDERVHPNAAFYTEVFSQLVFGR